MKVTKAAEKNYVPVSLTFETLEELARFVGAMGNLNLDASGLAWGIWGQLSEELEEQKNSSSY